ncbi:unnamed protein product [Prunus armeniaca]
MILLGLYHSHVPKVDRTYFNHEVGMKVSILKDAALSNTNRLDAIQMLKNIFTLDNNSSSVTLTYAVWTNLCACLGERSLSFLSVVIPSLIKKAIGSVRIEVDENPGDNAKH